MKKKWGLLIVLGGLLVNIVLNPLIAYQEELILPNLVLKEGEKEESIGIPSEEENADINEYKEMEGPYTKDSEEVKAIVEILNRLTFDEVLADFGGRVSAGTLNQNLHVSVSPEKENVDRYQLDGAFEALQENSEAFIIELLNHFEEYKATDSSEEIIEKVKNDLHALVLMKVYFDRWYGIVIEDQVLSDQLYFKQTSTKDILEMSGKIKKNPTILESHLTGRRYRETFQPYYGFSSIPKLVEAFISNETNSTNYDEWFHSYFKGNIYEVQSKYSSLNISTWDKVKDNLNRTQSTNESANGTDNLLLPLLMVKSSEGLVLGNTPGLIIYSSKKNYGAEVDKELDRTLENFKNHLEILLDTHTEPQRESLLQGIKTLPVYDSDRYDYGADRPEYNYLDSENVLSHEFYLSMGYIDNIKRGSGVLAAATPQGITFAVGKINESSGGTLAHEYHHSISHLLLGTAIDLRRYGYRGNISVESITSRINNSPWEWQGLPWVTYESTKYSDHTLDPLANSADRFKNPEDLQEYFGGYVNLVNCLNQVVADVVLQLPLEEQVGYIRRWEGDTGQTLTTLPKKELEELSLKTMDDLVDNQLAILDKSIPDGEAGEPGYGEVYYTRYSLYYAKKDGGDYLDQTGGSVEMFDQLMSLSEQTGWDAVQQFFSSATGAQSHLEALQLVTGDPEMDFVKFKKMKLHENEDILKKNGLKDHSYKELVTLFQQNPTKFETVKTDIYKHYIAETSEFRTSIFSDTSVITEGQLNIVLDAKSKESSETNIVGGLSEMTITLTSTGKVDSAVRNLVLSKYVSQFETVSDIVDIQYLFASGGDQTVSVPSKEFFNGNYAFEQDLKYGDQAVITYEAVPWNNSNESTQDADQVKVSYNDGAQETETSFEETLEVESGLFGFAEVPKALVFQTTPIGVNLTDQVIDREEDNWGIALSDYRGTNTRYSSESGKETPDRRDWELTATTGVFKDSTDTSVPSSVLSVAYVNNGEMTDLGMDEVVIESHSVKDEIPKEHHKVLVNWGKENGLKARVNNRNGLNATMTYQAQVNFELRVAP